MIACKTIFRRALDGFRLTGRVSAQIVLETGTAMRVLLATMMLLYSCTSALAEYFVSGEDLAENCSAYLKARDGALSDLPLKQQDGALKCSAFIQGVIDTEDAVISLRHSLPVYCEPDHLTLRKFVEIVAKYAENHPEKRSYSGAQLVLLALYKAFPCDP